MIDILTHSEDSNEVASVFVWFLRLDDEKLSFSTLSYFIVVVKNLSKSLSNVINFLLVHIDLQSLQNY